MYKRIERFGFSSNQFIKEIDDVFEMDCNKFMNEIEYVLLKKYYPSDMFNEDNTIKDFDCRNYNDEELLNKFILKKYIDILSNDEFIDFSIDFSGEECVEILDAILTQKLDDELSVNVAAAKAIKKNRNDKKEEDEKDFIKFKEYISKYNFSNRKISDFRGFVKENYLDTTQNNFIQDYINRPLYFIIYRVRNNIIKTLNHRRYSVKLLEKYIKDLKEKFKILLYKKIIQLNFAKIDIDKINAIYNVIEEEFLHQYLLDYRLGKTEKDGTKISSEVKKIIQELGIQENIKKELFQSFSKLFENYNEDDNVLWLRKYEDKFVIYIKKSSQLDGFDVGKEKNYQFNITRICDLFRIHTVSQIFSKLDKDNITILINSAYKAINMDEKADFIKEISGKFLELSNFTVALQVKDLVVKDEIFELKIADISFLSYELFKSWQYEIQTGMKVEEPHIFESDTKETHIYVLVKNVVAAREDTEKAMELAKEKLIKTLNMLYFFISREDEINFQIEPLTLILNNNCNTFSVSFGDVKRFEPKEIDDVDIELINFINKYFSSNYQWKNVVINALGSYMSLLKSKSVDQKIELQSKIIKQIFNKWDNVDDLAFNAAIIIAGSNISKDNATYRQMRLWLFEDFKELLNISNVNDKCLVLKERIYDRFKVFSRNIIGTILFNLDTIDDTRADIEQIIDWIAYMYPNNKLIRSEQNEQE